MNATSQRLTAGNVSNRIASLLPKDLSSWTSLVSSSLDKQYKSLTKPSHFKLQSITDGKTVSFSSSSVETNKLTRESAILLLLSPCETSHGFDMCFPLTMRTSHMRTHKGQMALPGGRVDKGETLQEAAMREAMEEIGVPSTAYTVLGTLQKVWSYPSKSWVTPFVAVAHDQIHPSINSPQEVESLHYLHLRSLLQFSGGTHVRIEKYWSPRSGGAVSMPAFFASDSLHAPIDQVLKPSNSRGLSTPSVNVGDGTPVAATSVGIEECDGTLVWGLTGFVVCEFISRLFAELMEREKQLHQHHLIKATTIPCSALIVEDPEADEAKKESVLNALKEEAEKKQKSML